MTRLADLLLRRLAGHLDDVEAVMGHLHEVKQCGQVISFSAGDRLACVVQTCQEHVDLFGPFAAIGERANVGKVASFSPV